MTDLDITLTPLRGHRTSYSYILCINCAYDLKMSVILTFETIVLHFKSCSECGTGILMPV